MRGNTDISLMLFFCIFKYRIFFNLKLKLCQLVLPFYNMHTDIIMLYFFKFIFLNIFPDLTYILFQYIFIPSISFISCLLAFQRASFSPKQQIKLFIFRSPTFYQKSFQIPFVPPTALQWISPFALWPQSLQFANRKNNTTDV